MQLHIGRNSTLSKNKPLLDTFVVDANGFLATPTALSFAIYDVSDAGKQSAPVEVVARTDIDLVNDKIGAGHFAATWTVGNETTGKHLIQWWCSLTDESPEQTWVKPFDVVWNEVIIPTARIYASISDVRCEGIGPMVSDMRILETLAHASKRLEMWTGRSFLPEYKMLRVDARPIKAIYLEEPIVGIENFGVFDPLYTFAQTSYVVYNRHLRQNLLSPDDRSSPRLEFKTSDSLYGMRTLEYLSPFVVSSDLHNSTTRIANRKSAQRLYINGAFGYTENDGSFEGFVPMNARDAVVRIALREVWPATSQNGQMFRDRPYVTSMKTREQTIQYRRDTGSGAVRSTRFTGDPNIDSLIEPLCKSGQVYIV